MAEYIDRQAVLDAIWPVDPENDGSDGCTVVLQNQSFTSEDIEAIVSEIPAANVREDVQARWVKIYKDGEPIAEQPQVGVCCSKCLKMPKDKFTESAFCPNCGAQMDGGANQ